MLYTFVNTTADIFDLILITISEHVDWQPLPKCSYRFHDGHVMLKTCSLALFTIIYKVNIIYFTNIYKVNMIYFTIIYKVNKIYFTIYKVNMMYFTIIYKVNIIYFAIIYKVNILFYSYLKGKYNIFCNKYILTPTPLHTVIQSIDPKTDHLLFYKRQGFFSSDDEYIIIKTTYNICFLKPPIKIQIPVILHCFCFLVNNTASS